MPEVPEKKVLRGLMALGQRIRTANRFAVPNAAAGENVVITFDDGSRITVWPGSAAYDVAKKLRPGMEIDFSFKGTREQTYAQGQTGLDQRYMEFLGVDFRLKQEEVLHRGVVMGESGLDQLPEEVRMLEDLPVTVRQSRAVREVKEADASATAAAGTATATAATSEDEGL